MILNIELEEWSGLPVLRNWNPRYARQPARAFKYKPASLTGRQAVFLRNLIRIAEVTGGEAIPVDFELGGGRRIYLDRGCIKMAEHAGFIAPLTDGPAGVVETIQLAWRW